MYEVKRMAASTGMAAQHTAIGLLLRESLSYVDAMYIPAMERFAANMPFIRGLSLRDNPAYPNLGAWLDAMNALPSYQQVRRSPAP